MPYNASIKKKLHRKKIKKNLKILLTTELKGAIIKSTKGNYPYQQTLIIGGQNYV